MAAISVSNATSTLLMTPKTRLICIGSAHTFHGQPTRRGVRQRHSSAGITPGEQQIQPYRKVKTLRSSSTLAPSAIASTSKLPDVHPGRGPSSSWQHAFKGIVDEISPSSSLTWTLSTTSDTEARFPARSTQMKILDSPSDFYKAVRGVIKRAKRRIFLSSLYIGKDETELIDCLRQQVESHPKLVVTILVDCLRSTREGPYHSSTATNPKANTSCASLLASLARDFPNQVNIRLYRAPKTPLWLERLVGKRFIEGRGLQHMKAYGGDDEFIMSGANLSSDYFTNRQDRYIHVWDHALLANYLHALQLLVSQFSYHLHVPLAKDGSSSNDDPYHSHYTLHWDNGYRLLLCENPNGTISPTAGRFPRIGYPEHNFLRPANWSLHRFMRNWQQHAARVDVVGEGYDSSVVPLIQMGSFGIKQEEHIFPRILNWYHNGRDGNARAASSSATSSSATSASASPTIQEPSSSSSIPQRIDFTTGYFSLYDSYTSHFLSLLSDTKKANSALASTSPSTLLSILTAAPISNGFFSSRGLSGLLPAAYTLESHRFYKAVQRHDLTDVVEIREWERKGWTYHAKGLWLTPLVSASASMPSRPQSQQLEHQAVNSKATLDPRPPSPFAPSSTSKSTPTPTPKLPPKPTHTPTHTLLGSSNFGHRSLLRDLECTLLIETRPSSTLSTSLAEEVDRLKAYAEKEENRVDQQLFDRPERRVGLGTRILTALVRKWL